MTKEKVAIFDTTLRDGQQCPGAGMSFKHNLQYAQLAARVKVDVLEAGFPAASKLDFDIVQAIASEFSSGEGPTIAALCQLRDEQIDRTIEALSPLIRSGKGRLHTYLPVAPGLMEASIGARASNRAGLVRDVEDFVRRAVQAGLEVEFSPEGYSRMGENFNFVSDCIRAAVRGGARVINCPDTIGGASKFQGSDYFVEKMKQHAELVAREFPGRDVVWSVHCHNDLGLAVENSLNGVFYGPARQIEGCFNGIGERAGNAALEQCIVNISMFGKHPSREVEFYTGIERQNLRDVCAFVATHMLPAQPHWPVSGGNACRHSSGGHTNAILKDPLAYQPYDPSDTGYEISFQFGPLSGGSHAQSIIHAHGYKCDDTEKAAVAQFIKDFYADRRKGVTDEELIRGYVEYRKPVRVEAFDYSKSSMKSQVSIRGEFFGVMGEVVETHEGRDSALAALKKAIDAKFPGYDIVSHKSESEGEGVTALSVSHITVKGPASQLFVGHGVDQDIEISAFKALIDAVNRAYVETHFREMTHG